MSYLVIGAIILAVILWVGFRPRAGAIRPQDPEHRFPKTGSCDQEIVGESFYQDALRSIAGDDETRMPCEAELILEDWNEYDSNAVAVHIKGKKVGHLSRSHAKRYRKRFCSEGRIRGVVDAVIVGGGDGYNLGVWIDLDLWSKARSPSKRRARSP